MDKRRCIKCWKALSNLVFTLVPWYMKTYLRSPLSPWSPTSSLKVIHWYGIWERKVWWVNHLTCSWIVCLMCRLDLKVRTVDVVIRLEEWGYGPSLQPKNQRKEISLFAKNKKLNIEMDRTSNLLYKYYWSLKHRIKLKYTYGSGM